MIYAYKRRCISYTLIILLLLILTGCSHPSSSSSNPSNPSSSSNNSVQTEKESPPTWQEQYDLGANYFSMGNYEEGIAALTLAIEIDPKPAEPYSILAEYFVNSSDYDAAAEILEQGVSNTDDELLKNMLANVSIDLNSIVTDAYSHTYTNEYD